ncbi:phosphatidate cytidylyltransferase [Mycoplasmopsis felifaucium]|uniref:Phosphatidate cytidylyltransferase n=1 Tax=Mycoplasmopsis felifaucium TaxID=35768 RepID=A0ABZ2RPP0_9BACT
MKLFKERILPALILGFIVLIFVIPISIFGNNHYQARIYGYVFAVLLLSFLLYELFVSFKMKWYLATVLTTIGVACIFFPIKNTLELVSASRNHEVHNYLMLIKKALFSWETITIISIISVSFYLIELNTISNVSWFDRFIRVSLVWFAMFFLINSIKFIQLALYYQWPLGLFLILAPSIVDVFGFFGGKLFGKKWIKLPFAPDISPKKTWEGFILGIIFGWIFCAGMIFGFNLGEGKLWAQILMMLFIPLCSVGGDLYFSIIKRMNRSKDYSKILAGHGGILDRFDSISFAVMFACIIYAFV